MIRFLQRLGRARNVLPSRSLRLVYFIRSRLRRRAPCLFVSAFPKSGSTFLVTALVHTSGYSRYFLGQNFNSEHDLNFPRLVDSWAMPIVSHQHTRATPPNLEYLEQFKIRPVILTRNLADCLVSLRDHLCTESLITPTFCAQPGFADWPTEQQYDALVDLAAGWYLDFYSGWRQAQAAGVEMLWLDYRTLIAQPGESLQQVLDFYHLPISESHLQDAISQTTRHGNTTRKNVGISGRGQSELTRAQLARLDLLTRHYPDTDFTSIGAPFQHPGGLLIHFLLVAKDWGGGLARYLSLALKQRQDIRPHWIKTYPASLPEKLIYRTQRQNWRDKLLNTINHTQRDIAFFINLPNNPQQLQYQHGNVLWLTDAPSYEALQYSAFSRIYVSDPGYAEDVKEIVGSAKFAGVLPFACEPSVHSPQSSQANTDVCFIGNRDLQRDAYLAQLLDSDCSCHIYGNYFAQHPLFWKHPSAFRPGVANSALAQTYARHRISLNIHARVVRAGTNMRTFECAACDIAQLVEYRPGIEDLFIPDEEICLFQNAEEFSMGLAKLLADEELRKAMRRRARDRVLAEHTYAHRLKTVLAEL